ncbi:hypothetical protein COCMIDRAFT_83358, partial [Bipolaris oryzae ATCC 44560]
LSPPPPHLVILAAAPLGLLIPPSRRSHPSQPSRSPRPSSLRTQPWGADVCTSRSAALPPATPVLCSHFLLCIQTRGMNDGHSHCTSPINTL